MNLPVMKALPDTLGISAQSGLRFCCSGCLFDLILYVPVNTFTVISGRVFLG